MPAFNITNGPFTQLVSSTEQAIKHVALRLHGFARLLLLAFKLTVKISSNLAFGAPDLGIMNSLTGNRKFINTLRGKSNTKRHENSGKNTGDSQIGEYPDGFASYWENNSPEVMFDADYNMSTSSQGRDKAKEEEQYKSVHKLLDQVMSEVHESGGKSVFIPDGERTRYQKPSASQATKNDEGNSMRPQPLQPRSAGRAMVAPEEREESLVDFLKDSEALAILQEQQNSEMEAQKAALEAAKKMEQASTAETPLLGPLRRKISSTFVKDTPEKSKAADANSPSASHPFGTYFRKPSSTKSSTRVGDGLPSIAETDGGPAHEEQAVGGLPYDSGYSRGITTPTPSSKSCTYKPLLTVNTTRADKKLKDSITASPALKSLSSKGTKNPKHVSPSVPGSPSIFSPTPTKPKPRKFKENDAVVKHIESQILREEWGVKSTPQLTSAYVKRPRGLATAISDTAIAVASTAETAIGSHRPRLHSDPASNTGATVHSLPTRQLQQNSNTPTGSFVKTIDQRKASDNSAECTGPISRSATGPHNSFESTNSAPNNYDSQGSTVASLSLRASADTNQSTNTPGTPETPNSGGSVRIRRKVVGSGNNRTILNNLTDSPTNSLGRVTGNICTDPFGDYSPSFVSDHPRPGTERSFTDPYNGQAAIGSIVRAARSAFVDVFNRSVADPITYSFKQQSTSSQGASFADSTTSLVPRPLRRTEGSPLDNSFDKSNTSSYTGSYELKVLPSRGHNSNEYNVKAGPPHWAAPGNARNGRSAEYLNQPGLGPFELGTSPTRASFDPAIETPGIDSTGAPITGPTSGPFDHTTVSPLSAFVGGDDESTPDAFDESLVSPVSPSSGLSSKNPQGYSERFLNPSIGDRTQSALDSPAGYFNGSAAIHVQPISAPSTGQNYGYSYIDTSQKPGRSNSYMDQATPVHRPGAIRSPSDPLQSVIARDFQNPHNAGAPSNRLKHEDNAEEERHQKKMSKQDYVAYKVQILRKKTKTEIIQYNRHDQYPRNPNHARRFHSKNLWCSQCTSSCAVCNAPCCALKGATLTVLSDRATPMQKVEAIIMQKEITTWMTTGLDNQTFMDCTECQKFVCPDCTSICPVEPCYDRLCKSCNPSNFWQPCGYHTQNDVEWSNKRAHERRLEEDDLF